MISWLDVLWADLFVHTFIKNLWTSTWTICLWTPLAKLQQINFNFKFQKQKNSQTKQKKLLGLAEPLPCFGSSLGVSTEQLQGILFKVMLVRRSSSRQMTDNLSHYSSSCTQTNVLTLSSLQQREKEFICEVPSSSLTSVETWLEKHVIQKDWMTWRKTPFPL